MVYNKLNNLFISDMETETAQVQKENNSVVES